MNGDSTGIIDLAARYDQFQSEAVRSIVRDYKEHAAGRFLLVIPTGGGKTFTAVKAINALFHQGVLDPQEDRVVWAAHRQELVKQAADTFAQFEERSPEESYVGRIHIMMISGVAAYIRRNDDVKIVVIDEAHHAATANIQYGPLFQYPKLGILGLTATPSRHDGQALEFDKESYSIGFPDLIEKQIILSPEIRKLVGEKFEEIVASGSSFSGLEALSTAPRNQKIISHIEDNAEDYSKIIIYAGSVGHAKDLYTAIKESSLSNSYEAVDYIVGAGWSGNDAERKDFIERLKSYRRSIVINHDVLTEGYDDPRVNTIIMARPSRSKLVYMQAVGRGIRIDPENPGKKAFIVEIDDDLPNIRYRIDNRWLFSEISDLLEPQVTDEYFGTRKEFEETIKRLYERLSVDPMYQFVPDWDERMRYSLLFFRYLAGDGTYRHIPLIIDGASRVAVSNWFNFISERIESYRRKGVNPEQAMKMARYNLVPGLDDLTKRRLIMDAMEQASEQVSRGQLPAADITYWIRFVALRFRGNTLSEELREFIEPMVNRDQLEQELFERNFESGSQVVRFPLPLAAYFGQILTAFEFSRLEKIVDALITLKGKECNIDHRASVRDVLDASILPIDMIYRDALTTIVREADKYHIKLE